MSLFGPPLTTGPFAPCAGHGTTVQLTFERPTRSQNSAGEVVLSFASAVTLTGDLQPYEGAASYYKRHKPGTLDPVDYGFTVLANADVRPGDRTTISAQAVEIAAVDHWGTLHTEVWLMYVGR